MNELSEMQSFEVKEVIIDFTQPPWLIQRQILSLPFDKQQKWIDLWLEKPEIKKDLERKRQDRLIHPPPMNTKRQDKHWED